MKWAKVVALVGALAMGAALFYGFTQGDLGAEGAIIGGIPWGVVSLVDVYVGFILFAVWVIYREEVLWQALIWVVLIMVLGNFTASVYALQALMRSQGNWKRFWLGKNYSK